MTLSVLDAAHDSPGRIAVIHEGRSLSFAELASAVSAKMTPLEDALRGTDTASPVAIVASLELSTLISLYATFELGRPAAPVSPRLTPHERAAYLDELGPAIVVEPSPGREQSARPGSVERRAPRVADDERPLAIAATAGTTGRPRLAVLSRAAFRASAAGSAANLGWREEDRWLVCMPLSHIGGLSILTRCLIARRALVLMPHFDPALVLATIRDQRVTLMSVVPTMLEQLLSLDPRPGDLRSLRAVLVGGAPALPSLLRRARAGGFPALATYGLTETCSQVATQSLGDAVVARTGGDTDSGRPLPGFDVCIADEGIQVRGAALFSGYHTRDGLVEVPLAEGWFDTGDRGHLDEGGRLHVHGRRGDIIVTGGEKVHPAEVEAVLLSSGEIRLACVFGVPDPAWGELVSAALVARDESSRSAARLADHLRAHLASWKRPRRVAWMSELPLTPAGKPDRAETARRAAPFLQELI